MSEKWLEMQSFLSDQDVLSSIDDLSIALKQDLAGVADPDRAERANAARTSLRSFLSRLGTAVATESGAAPLGIDRRFKRLADDFRMARRDTAHFQSRLMREGVESTIELLDRDDARSKEALIACLSELRRVVARHQQADTTAILEDL